MVDGRYSPPTLPRSRTMDVSNGVPVHPAKEKPPINVVGDVGGRIAIMVVSKFNKFESSGLLCITYLVEFTMKVMEHKNYVYIFVNFIKVLLELQDDMVDDVASFVAAAEVLKERGAYKIYVMATHGLLSSDAPRLIEDSPIDEVFQHVSVHRAHTRSLS